MGVAHWDEVETHRRAKGEMDATWQWLGNAAETRGVGVNRVRVEPGKLPTPPHSHGASEEIYFVLSGSGLAWQDETTCEVAPDASPEPPAQCAATVTVLTQVKAKPCAIRPLRLTGVPASVAAKQFTGWRIRDLPP